MTNDLSRRYRAILTFATSAILGAAIWWLSPRLTGEAEAWDGPFWYYPAALFVAGLLGSASWPTRPGIAVAGVAVGQLVFVAAVLPGGALWILGIVFGLACLAFAAAGAGTAWALSRVGAAHAR